MRKVDGRWVPSNTEEDRAAMEACTWFTDLRAAADKQVQGQRSSYSSLADHAGISVSHLNRLLRGDTYPSMRVAEALAAAVGMKLVLVPASTKPAKLRPDGRGRPKKNGR